MPKTDTGGGHEAVVVASVAVNGEAELVHVGGAGPRLAVEIAVFSAGMNIAASTAMMAMTTRSSINVKACFRID